jgi:hypothetical protein
MGHPSVDVQSSNYRFLDAGLVTSDLPIGRPRRSSTPEKSNHRKRRAEQLLSVLQSSLGLVGTPMSLLTCTAEFGFGSHPSHAPNNKKHLHCLGLS